VNIPGDPKRRKPDPEYGIAIRVKSQFGAEDGVAWVNVSRNKVPYASLCEQITVATDDGGTKQYVCCMNDLLPAEYGISIPMSCFSDGGSELAVTPAEVRSSQ
jgi:hypothetical protein